MGGSQNWLERWRMLTPPALARSSGLQLGGEDGKCCLFIKSLFKCLGAFFLIIVCAFSYYFLGVEEWTILEKKKKWSGMSTQSEPYMSLLRRQCWTKFHFTVLTSKEITYLFGDIPRPLLGTQIINTLIPSITKWQLLSLASEKPEKFRIITIDTISQVRNN